MKKTKRQELEAALVKVIERIQEAKNDECALNKHIEMEAEIELGFLTNKTSLAKMKSIRTQLSKARTMLQKKKDKSSQFLVDHLVLQKHPEKLAIEQFRLSEVIEATDGIEVIPVSAEVVLLRCKLAPDLAFVVKDKCLSPDSFQGSGAQVSIKLSGLDLRVILVNTEPLPRMDRDEFCMLRETVRTLLAECQKKGIRGVFTDGDNCIGQGDLDFLKQEIKKRDVNLSAEFAKGFRSEVSLRHGKRTRELVDTLVQVRSGVHGELTPLCKEL